MKNTLFAAKIDQLVGTPYVYATFGRVLTTAILESIAKQYPAMFTPAYKEKAKKFIGKQTFDCTGIIEYVLMGGTPSGVSYKSSLDYSASGWIARCKNVQKVTSGDRPKTGSLLYKPGASISHVGVYIGNGLCVHSKGIDYGTIREDWTKHGWTQYGEIPEIDYTAVSEKHWAVGARDYLQGAGILDTPLSDQWKDLDNKISDITVGVLLSLVAKTLGWKP